MIHARDDYTSRIQDDHGLIPKDEPVLLIRGQDRAAVPCMIAWIAAYLEMGGSDLEMLATMGRHLERIRDWQERYGNKVADLPWSGS